MTSPTLLTTNFPSRYVQGSGAMAQLIPELDKLGKHPVIYIDQNAYSAVIDALQPIPSHVSVFSVEAECTTKKIEQTLADLQSYNADCIVGMGGGKVIDLCRASADMLSDKLGKIIPFVSVPTVAASDAPCSSLAVIYSEEGAFVKDLFVKRPPNLVLVDSAIVIGAPARTFAAGVGDAIATWYEAESCLNSGTGNFCGGFATQLSTMVAQLCRDTLFENAVQAVEDCHNKRLSPAFEKVLEANILLSGIGFESVGVASAHAVHHGLTELPASYERVHHLMHGEKVAFGVVVSMILNDKPQLELEKVIRLFQAIDLPCNLDDLGIKPTDTHAIDIIATKTCEAGSIAYNEPVKITHEIVVDAIQRAHKAGKAMA
ncbi:putative Glycerol dehydrogenase [Vibrio nigripulchritudo SO65]|uniref:glycerol dehydrogenase n=1 Tax=Vibrio nigripulchritudo TaxID=28173 RepID=UPI0003B1CD76|nr:glycerol dehydrogenase [Vibrio nigripulchritudo]CCN36553.1 putative Glycerol dehydrogenase [Vibrio nigripulchritudo AM115]CCN43633.1 putative Glycerol dehydrogenase [Vibrio nigripulchritudo FTn2]CCN65334.1 putative Glycerol dehydrogenase [Vibrio nigripulchritudo POn4]CCN77692.1 putative Glycerol dehydrogenase [Vibrio nigripulchritudo SO65]